MIEVPDFPENERGYRLSAERIAALIAEYVRYRKADGTIPQPHLDIVSALSELAALRGSVLFLDEQLKKSSAERPSVGHGGV